MSVETKTKSLPTRMAQKEEKGNRVTDNFMELPHELCLPPGLLLGEKNQRCLMRLLQLLPFHSAESSCNETSGFAI